MRHQERRSTWTSNNTLWSRLSAPHVEDGHTFGPGERLLTVFPLRGERHGHLDYVTLEAALAAKSIAIGELDEPQVNALAVTNRGTRPVLITDGDTLVGGQQNRVVNSTILVPPGRLTPPVGCVERGRWHPQTQGFALSESAYPALRRAKATQVGRRIAAIGSTPHRGSGRDLAGCRRAASCGGGPFKHGGIARPLHRSPRPSRRLCTGRALSTGYRRRDRRLRGPDRRARTLRRAGHAPDVLAPPDPRGGTGCAGARSRRGDPLPRAVRTLHRPQQAACQRFPSPGVGDDLRLAGGGAAGAALLHDGVVVHAVLHRVAEQA